MSDLVQGVTPLTRAIVWLRPAELSSETPHYREIDYLLDGLLTAATRESTPVSSLLVGKNFNRKLFIFSTEKTPAQREWESFLSLLEKDLAAEDKILIVDDVEGRENLLKLVPQKLLSHFQLI